MNHSVYSQGKIKSKKSWSLVATIIVIGLLIVIVWVVLKNNKKSELINSSAITNTVNETPNEPKSVQQLPNIQAEIDSFINKYPGDYGIKIIDLNGKTLAETAGDKQYFTASIYKLFVAYVGHQKIDDGTFSADEPYLANYTRGKCLDAMIRDSNSSCAEKMWNELGKEELTKQMQSLGLKNTSLVGLNTTANDTSVILQKIAKGEGLSKKSQEAFLNSMKDQDAKYRRGLPSGFTKSTVYNKVGWNEDKEWHDTAIVELANGQKIIVSVFTSGVGYKTVSALGSKIETTLN